MHEQLKSWANKQIAGISQYQVIKQYGLIKEVQGLLAICSLPRAKVGDLCKIILNDKGTYVLAEVIGFDNNKVMISALGNLDGVTVGSRVIPLYHPHQIEVSDELLGQILDGFGRTLDCGKNAFTTKQNNPRAVPVIQNSTSALERPRISNALSTGVTAIDALMTLGTGQRVGIFAGAGCGKTSLIAQIARGVPCDVIVFCLIGERGRELREFLEHELDDELRKRTVLVCATSDQSSMERARAAFTATAIAEGFRNSGKHVLLLVDSLTRLARAQREIGLAAGEPPGRGGLPPSVYNLLPRLIERAGKTEKGVITAIYTVLTEQDSMNDPVADEARSLLDGHIILSRRLAEQTHFPAIDVQASLSRVMSNVVDSEHIQMANHFRQLLAAHKDVEMLLKLGEYQKGDNELTDKAVSLHPNLMSFLQQSQRNRMDLISSIKKMAEVLRYEKR